MVKNRFKVQGSRFKGYIGLTLLTILKMTVQADSAEKAAKARSESILLAECIESGGFSVQALAGGDNPRHYTRSAC